MYTKENPKLFTPRVIENRGHKAVGSLSLKVLKENFSGQGSEQPDPTVKLIFLGLKDWTSRGPLQPESLHDSETEKVG